MLMKLDRHRKANKHLFDSFVVVVVVSDFV